MRELNEKYVEILDPIVKDNLSYTEYLHEFIKHSFKRREILEEFAKKIGAEFINMKLESEISYLDYYKFRITQEIRELKTNKILN